MAAVSTLPAEELPFLAEICAAPDDDGPRLVFADWLEERGDIRGEMLRVGCALARLELDDPQYDALAAREAELREPCTMEWLARLPQIEGVEYHLDPQAAPSNAWRGDDERSSFTRGLLESVVVDHPASISSSRHLFESYCIRTVRLNDLDPGSSAAWKRVVSLVLSGDAYEHVPLLRSRQLSGLRRLMLVPHGNAYDIVQAMAANPALAQLRSLILWDQLHDDSLTALREWPHMPLREVGVFDRGGHLTPAAVTKWLVSPAASQLESLAFTKVEFGPLAHIVLGSANLRTLRRLALTPAGLQRATPEALAALVGLPRLEWLTLTSNMLGDGAVAAMAPSLHGGLRRLDLDTNRLGAKAVAALVGADLSGLRRLRLSHNQLNDEAAVQLAASPQFAGLLDLDLFSNQIGDKGALALAESPHLTGLKRLDLFNNPIKRAYTRDCLAERFGAGVSLSPA